MDHYHLGPKYHELNTTDQNLVFQHVRTFPSMKVHVYIYATWPMVNPRVYTPLSQWTCVYLSDHLFFAIYLLYYNLVIWVSCHQGQHLYHTCIIMPTISPFGLDGNNHTKSLSPFDIKGKGWTKILSSLIYILLSILPLSTCKVCKIMTLYIHHQWTSYHQKLIHTSISQPSGDTPFWLIHPTKWGYAKCLYMSEIDIITSSFPCKVGLQIRSFHDLYIKLYTCHL